ncbi:MAG: TonB-dependent receptor plug domain-containing protein [Gemmatimonadaceae bacterium]
MVGARLLVAVIPALAFACTPPRLGPGEIANSSVITEEEIIASRATNALEVIKKLRANFLNSRGETSLRQSQSQPYPTVYVDDQEFGPITTLSSIPAGNISTIRLYRVSEANVKYGSQNISGVIAITTRQ